VPEQQPERRAGTFAVQGDEQLLEQFLFGDEQAYVVLYERYEKGVLTYLRTILKEQPEVADDLFQETFIKLFRERGRYRTAQQDGGEYRPIQNFRGWLFRVAHNQAISHLRSARQSYSLSEDEDTHRWDERLMVPIEESFASMFGQEDDLANEALYEKFKDCVALLPQSLREVYVLREMNGLEYEDVAETVGCTPEAARMRLSRARRALRKALEKYLPSK
jgi:RNA polymerase sigma-70 factor (ECF subfamily)